MYAAKHDRQEENHKPAHTGDGHRKPHRQSARAARPRGTSAGVVSREFYCLAARLVTARRRSLCHSCCDCRDLEGFSTVRLVVYVAWRIAFTALPVPLRCVLGTD